MKAVVKSSARDDGRHLRVIGGSCETSRPPDPQTITHLPSTVTTRRAHSPTRRPPSAQGDYSQGNVINGEQHKVPHVSKNDGKFFHASEMQQASRTPTTTNKKPAFFTANSFSNTIKTASVTPELRRAGSAVETRSRSESKPTAIKRTPRLRDTSPDRRIQTGPSQGLGHDLWSPSPFETYGGVAASKENDIPQARSLGRTTQRLPRQISLNSLHQMETNKPACRSSDTPTTNSTTRQVQRLSTSEKLANSEIIQETSPRFESSPPSLGLPEPVSTRSPQSSVSTSTTYSNPDDEDLSSLQPIQVNRKIMDLEIRTTSLLAVNNQLERQTRKQAAEMRDLRKCLAHASRYPNKAAMNSDCLGANSGVAMDIVGDDAEDEEDGTDNLHQVGLLLATAASNVDRAISRALLLSDQLLEDAQKGLRYKPRESEIGVGIRKVLYDEFEDEDISRAGDERQERSVVNDEDISGLNLRNAMTP